MNHDMDLTQILDRVISGLSLTEFELETLSKTDPSERLVRDCARLPLEDLIAKFPQLHAEIGRRGTQVKPLDLWSRYIPLAQLLLHWTTNHEPCLIGVTGVPGTGKSSLVRILSSIAEVFNVTTAVASLDDFYLTPVERQTLGHNWRGIGAHDLTLLQEFVDQITSETGVLAVPRYDTSAEMRLPPVMYQKPKLVLVEGWLVGTRIPEYASLTSALDRLIYLDTDLEWAHHSRVKRERRIREQSSGTMGMSQDDVERFWQEALLPGATKWVLPLKNEADVVLTIGPEYQIDEILVKTEDEN
jgi:pantothenate kinase-related protein Tda10